MVDVLTLLSRMQSKLNQFFAHREPRHPHPPGCFGLVAMSQLDGSAEHLSLRRLQQLRVGILYLASLGISYELIH